MLSYASSRVAIEEERKNDYLQEYFACDLG